MLATRTAINTHNASGELTGGNHVNGGATGNGNSGGGADKHTDRKTVLAKTEQFLKTRQQQKHTTEARSQQENGYDPEQQLSESNDNGYTTDAFNAVSNGVSSGYSTAHNNGSESPSYDDAYVPCTAEYSGSGRLVDVTDIADDDLIDRVELDDDDDVGDPWVLSADVCAPRDTMDTMSQSKPRTQTKAPTAVLSNRAESSHLSAQDLLRIKQAIASRLSMQSHNPATFPNENAFNKQGFQTNGPLVETGTEAQSVVPYKPIRHKRMNNNKREYDRLVLPLHEQDDTFTYEDSPRECVNNKNQVGYHIYSQHHSYFEYTWGTL